MGYVLILILAMMGQPPEVGFRAKNGEPQVFETKAACEAQAKQDAVMLSKEVPAEVNWELRCITVKEFKEIQ